MGQWPQFMFMRTHGMKIPSTNLDADNPSDNDKKEAVTEINKLQKEMEALKYTIYGACGPDYIKK